MLDTNLFLEREKISSLMIRYSVPLIVSLLVAALYNIVDQIFIITAQEDSRFYKREMNCAKLSEV